MRERSRIEVAGIGVVCGLGRSRTELVSALETRSVAETKPFFGDEAAAYGILGFNPAHVPLRKEDIATASPHGPPADRRVRLLENVVQQALDDAGLDETALSAPRVQTYVGGAGMTSEILDFIAYLRLNDEPDLRMQPGIRNLHSRNHSQDDFACALVERYRLSEPPISVFAASCSSMSAVFLAVNALRSHRIEMALILSWQDVTLYDLMFFQGIGGLSRKVAQPFSGASDGVLPAVCMGAMLLRRREARDAERMHVASLTFSQNHGAAAGGKFLAPDFRVIARTISDALMQANMTERDVSCIFAHGNGMRGCDQAEIMAVQKIWGERAVPLVSYKGQTGYAIGASALLDFAIMDDALRSRRVLSAHARASLDEASAIPFHFDRAPMQTSGGPILKVAIGIDGSIAAGVFSTG